MATEHAYQYSVVDMKVVYDEIDEYIIPENQEACKLLWSKNIFTKMCNNYDNEDSWITFSQLSEENQALFDELAKTDSRFGKTWGGIGIRVPIRPNKGNDTYEAFKELIDLFPMQDVQKDGYMTVEEFMIYYTDCYSIIDNPDYKPLIKPRREDYSDDISYAKAFFAFADSIDLPSKVRVFDETKMTKSAEEYIRDSKFSNYYDADDGKVFYNQMYYDAHMRFKKINKTKKY